MPDPGLAKLERQLQADPGNRPLRLALIKTRSRIEGAAAFLELLTDRRLWKLADESSQDLAVELIGQRLGPDFTHLESDVFRCGLDSAGEPQWHRIAIFQHLKTTMEFNLIPAGSFLMGNPGIVKPFGYQGAPQRRVTLPRPFLIGRYPLTDRQWNLHPELRRSWVEDSPRPATHANYYEMMEWLTWADSKFRIPTEVEWEYACRAGTQGPYFWGPGDDGEWFYWPGKGIGRSVYAHINHANAFGLVDMLGNVAETCYDLTPEQEEQVQLGLTHPHKISEDLSGCGLADIEEHGLSYCHDRTYIYPIDARVREGFRLVRPFTPEELAV